MTDDTAMKERSQATLGAKMEQLELTIDSMMTALVCLQAIIIYCGIHIDIILHRSSFLFVSLKFTIIISTLTLYLTSTADEAT